MQDVLVLTDTYLRPDNLSKNISIDIPSETRERICSMAHEVTNLCDQIVRQLRKRMKQLAGRLSDTLE